MLKEFGRKGEVRFGHNHLLTDCLALHSITKRLQLAFCPLSACLILGMSALTPATLARFCRCCRKMREAHFSTTPTKPPCAAKRRKCRHEKAKTLRIRRK